MKCYKIINVFVNGSLSIMHVAIVILELARPYLIYCDTHTRIQTKHTQVNIYACVYIRMIFMMYIQPLLRSYFGIVQWWKEVKIYGRSIFICVCGCTMRYTCLSITWMGFNVLLMAYIVCPAILWTAKILNNL